MSDETLTDEALEDLRAKAQEAKALPAAEPHGAPHPTLRAFQGAATPEVVLTLIEELQRLREEERKRASNFDWLAKARREGTAVSLGRSGWSLPPKFKNDSEK
jgi:hypothetical protein